ncbi:hypothetical protein B0H17DRAFT_1126643 [Mycena rosella]|uniref:Uncharacterized protein n=1 Tax=Mycena rosella TaxID=1033263 RepID=A0AAD7GTZ3_MYCRO|nr:hypothetical protein B0H17DRAFT_1126643 [Mycena rosella]
MPSYDWGIPGLPFCPPPFRDGYELSAVPTPFSRLKFSPIGLFDLRRRLGVLPAEPTIFKQFQARFRTADFGWFASGASTDGQHIPAPNSFFPEFDNLRQTLPIGRVGNEARKALQEEVQHAVFDLATLWDRTFGGATMIMHVEGTTVPNTPALVQYLRCATYLPPSFIADNPASHGPIARIVQTFLESVGVPTVQKWRANANARGWPLMQPGPGAHVNAPSTTLIPQPAPNSAHYKFLGHPVGAIDDLIPTTTAPPVIIIPDDDDDLNGSTLDFMQHMERLDYAEMEAEERLQRIHQLEEQEGILVSQVAALEAALTREREVNTDLRAASRLNMPARSQVYQPRPPQTPSRHPPPYSGPSPNASRLLSATSTPYHATHHVTTASPSRHAANRTELDACISSYGLEPLAAAIKVMMRLSRSVKWYEELIKWNHRGSGVELGGCNGRSLAVIFSYAVHDLRISRSQIYEFLPNV